MLDLVYWNKTQETRLLSALTFFHNLAYYSFITGICLGILDFLRSRVQLFLVVDVRSAANVSTDLALSCWGVC